MGVKLLLLWRDASHERPVSETARLVRAAVVALADVDARQQHPHQPSQQQPLQQQRAQQQPADAAGAAAACETEVSEWAPAAKGAGCELSVVRSWEFPGEVLYAVKSKCMVARADAALQAVLQGDAFVRRLRGRFEGTTHRMGDFTLRVLEARLEAREETSAVVIECTYEPLQAVELATQLLREYTEQLLAALTAKHTGLKGQLLCIHALHASYDLPAEYAAEHLCLQYSQCLGSMVRSSQQAAR